VTSTQTSPPSEGIASVPGRAVRTLIQANGPFFGALIFFLLMMAAFTVAAPQVFLKGDIFTAVFVSLPIFIMLATSLVFLVTAGEIDLSFPSVIGFTAFVFAKTSAGGAPLPVAVLAAVGVGVFIGVVNGLLVAAVGLSSLVVTLGMNFLIGGLILIVSDGRPIDLTYLADSPVRDALVGKTGPIPHQMFWGLLFALAAGMLFSRHRFGAHVRVVGDNAEAAREMGISVIRIKIQAFALVGVAAALSGVFGALINQNFFSTLGQGYLLSALAAVFVGGTPTWGGVGTIAGAVLGAFTVGFIESGIVAAGLTGFYTQLFYGLVIILSLVGHRLIQGRPSRT
jgi:ribose/xylose/arabinose/galactoside ABC-type transport system permease subunit